mmetsp:Transcript_28914/g.47782  ORF Transcript_28914/g.47782 Transcript_28914/m.47782 type:complete len:183 (+) Transcript_28914:107-655(+)
MTSYAARPPGDSKALQERLHELISRVSDTTDVVKGWPESTGDNAQIHVKTTSKLINSMREILKAIERVEGIAKKDEVLWTKLQECPIPLDLLDLMDCANGLNPELLIRGLLREALSQLAGLRRRKVALEMLGNAIQAGLNKRKGVKRERDSSSDDGGNDGRTSEPPAKRAHTIHTIKAEDAS